MFLPNYGERDIDGGTSGRTRFIMDCRESRMNEFSWAPWRINVLRLELSEFLSGVVWKWGLLIYFDHLSLSLFNGNQYFNNSDHEIWKPLNEMGVPCIWTIPKCNTFQSEHFIRDPVVEGLQHFCFARVKIWRKNEGIFKDRFLRSPRARWHPWARCKVYRAGGIQLNSEAFQISAFSSVRVVHVERI